MVGRCSFPFNSMPNFLYPPPPWRPALWLLAVTLAAAGCKKDDAEALPQATQSGANTFGCKVNGEVWVPGGYRTSSGKLKKFSVYYSPTPVWSPSTKGRFALTAYRENDDHDDNVIIAIDSLVAPGIYLLNTRTPPYPAQTPYPNHGAYLTSRPAAATYVTGPAHTGSITITRLDTAAHIISGTFSFTAGPYSGTTNTVQVSDGRFDINYRNQP